MPKGRDHEPHKQEDKQEQHCKLPKQGGATNLTRRKTSAHGAEQAAKKRGAQTRQKRSNEGMQIVM